MAYLGERRLANFRPEKMSDGRKYLDSFAGKPCEVCGSTDTTVPAHIRLLHFGGSQKPADWQVVPLCFEHHAEQEHGGWEWLLRHILFPILKRRYERWKRGH
jgi:hypothetical protein